MKIELYKAQTEEGVMLPLEKLKRQEFSNPKIQKNENLNLENKNIKYSIKKIKHYQFLGNMLYIVDYMSDKYFFDIICD